MNKSSNNDILVHSIYELKATKDLVRSIASDLELSDPEKLEAEKVLDEYGEEYKPKVEL